MPVRRLVRWLIALGVTAAGFVVVLWIAGAWGGLDRATALSVALAAAPLLAGPFAWWASQPIEVKPRRTSATGAGGPVKPGAVFVCYSQTDGREYAQRLVENLAEAGIPAWMDREIVSGQRWTRTIEEQLDACSAVVVVMTPAASKSEWVGREILHARAAGKEILPLLRSGRPFFSLADVHYEDVTTGSLPGPQFLSRLADLAGIAPPAPPQDAPPPDTPRGPRFTVRWRYVAAALAVVVLAIGIRAIVVYSAGRQQSNAGAAPHPAYPYARPGVVVSPDGQWLYVTVNYHLASGDNPGWRGAVVAVDAQTRVASDPFWFVAGAGHGIVSPDGKQMYVAVDNYGVVNIFQLGANPMGIGGFELPAPTASADTHRRMAISDDGRRLYVADPGASAIWPADPHEDAVGKAITLHDAPQDMVMSPDGTRLYVAVRTGYVVTIDTATGKTLNDYVGVGDDPRAIATSRDGTRLYVANHGSDTISTIDPRRGTVIRQFRPACGTKPIAVAAGRLTNHVYVACENADTVTAADGATGAALGPPIKVGERPSSLALSPDGTRLYVVTLGATTVDIAIVDTSTNTLVVPPFAVATWYGR
ncbi:40-residue YVTN family beta-propeller repeat-containing protein [Asanoa hainanensis]|uniref:40-residue YVTN family beta-propeller repeat-containing protein n=1 Tax=Asanoa hainanensis TaxID=560556 RepID=A0A239N430_9ACTN|nr:TIR domain-containing protein [Asanoa hainanensis]SNT48938.1 40-residue YVTN family beta-propeller repeat-containing protein [Asanoa hainanensis]